MTRPAAHIGFATDFYQDGVDYQSPVSAGLTGQHKVAWPAAGYAEPVGWADKTATVHGRPYSPARTASSPTLTKLSVTNPVLSQKRGFPSPLLTDTKCVGTRSVPCFLPLCSVSLALFLCLGLTL